ncbi:pilus assembly protein TadG-related protein [Roseibium sediminicola]|uniref:Pilus assembly protein TadG-related protein n=1 Tax=Roseibium sediminicola TaxID=2933272 RepID=A0ABT0H055_9HYPH|nr:pilus assembly protein TadG-related protein [Roseibium sp. CAU 1639]MCK7614470.1 pilus assembly protein TadG-related protein [Roseibium sp. CAU 1639]
MGIFNCQFIRCRAAGFSRNREASVLPIFGLMVIMLVVIAGAAFDVTRTVNAREKLAFALDAAALSVARSLSTTLMTDADIKLELEDSLKTNLYGEEFLAEAIKNLDPDVKPENGTVTVSSRATLNNYFLDFGGYGMKTIGPETFAFSASSQVTYSQYEVEVALVLDVTGSMGTNSNDIKALRTAAKDLVKELISEDTDEADSKIRISVVPYSQGVNLGSNASTVTNNQSGSKNCVTERPGEQRFTDAIYKYDSSDSEFFGSAGKILFRNGKRQQKYQWGEWVDSPWGEACPKQEILPLTANRAALDTKIGALTASGGTAGQTGIAWGWYTLAPDWGALWPTSAPAEYGEGTKNDKIKKFAVIMTDGDFNNYFDAEEYSKTTEVCDWVESSSKKKKKSKKEWKCWDETTTETVWTEFYQDYADIGDESADRGLELCDKMKDEHIHIYSVYFETNGSDFGEDLMRGCATDAKSFFLATSTTDLENAFSNIAKKIQAIYVSK